MTVLILAAEGDLTADAMVQVLDRRGVPIVRIDTAWFPQQADLDAELRNGRWMGTLSADGRTIALEGLRSIWYRSPGAFTPPAAMTATERRWAVNETRFGLGGVLASLPVTWVNHPSRNADAAYKPIQLTTATACGLTVPDTMITNQPDAVRRFAADGEIVTKALSAPMIIEEGGRKMAYTHRVDAADLADLRGLDVATHQFQRWVPKRCEARLFVVGDNVFAAEIHADSAEGYIDFRADYTALRYKPVTPPLQVVSGVLDYCVRFDLAYGAFDFVIRPDGGWVFLECNPSGQYGWIETATGDPITETLADLLAQGPRP